MQASVSRRDDVLGLPAAVCCSSGRDETSASVSRGSAGSVLVCFLASSAPDTPLVQEENLGSFSVSSITCFYVCHRIAWN